MKFISTCLGKQCVTLTKSSSFYNKKVKFDLVNINVILFIIRGNIIYVFDKRGTQNL